MNKEQQIKVVENIKNNNYNINIIINDTEPYVLYDAREHCIYIRND